MAIPMSAVDNERPWTGACATTGLTMAEFAARLEGTDVPEWVSQAAVAICRSYGITGLCDPAYIANVIARRAGELNNHALADLTSGYEYHSMAAWKMGDGEAACQRWAMAFVYADALASLTGRDEWTRARDGARQHAGGHILDGAAHVGYPYAEAQQRAHDLLLPRE